MVINIDLHSHSGASGGVGDINFRDVYTSMKIKGIDVYGTGDCLYPKWLKYLEEKFKTGSGLLYHPEYPGKYFLLQTELIFTIPHPYLSNRRKLWHNVVLFPNFKACHQVIDLLDQTGVKNTIGRPFVKFDKLEGLENFLLNLININQDIEVIPAHIFTPQGAFGSTSPINSLKELYGNFLPNIHAVETGLSADPHALMMIPELDGLNYLSFSDAHSAKLNRLGREFTKIEVKNITYPSIIQAIREHHILGTTEFSMAEGRYFLTGHRQRNNHPGWCYFSPRNVPQGNICPLCGKKLTVGVLDRVLEVAQHQGGENRKWGTNYGIPRSFRTVVPLIEVVASALEIKSTTSNKVRKEYWTIIKQTTTEAALWDKTNEEIVPLLQNKISEPVLKALCSVNEGAFCFDPPGHDGAYGQLAVGEKLDLWDIDKVYPAKELGRQPGLYNADQTIKCQGTLF